MTHLVVGTSIITGTLSELKRSGSVKKEGVVLWLGHRHGERVHVVDTVVPEHYAESDVFRIPHRAILTLIEYSSSRGLVVAAQVHSHPKQAFHSPADDRWAIVRHVGAVSIVIPWFARTTTVESYWHDAAVFCLSRANTWDEISGMELDKAIVRTL